MGGYGIELLCVTWSCRNKILFIVYCYWATPSLRWISHGVARQFGGYKVRWYWVLLNLVARTIWKVQALLPLDSEHVSRVSTELNWITWQFGLVNIELIVVGSILPLVMVSIGCQEVERVLALILHLSVKFSLLWRSPLVT